ncbi:DUF4349 domain-containing protein [Halalkalibacillus halophilus]|uniref:DUF4349 domain-containing protein n=1 Tax=Halalkalibacillus halophilus TaxID=392827 RepID=UPI0004038056|nr:DUF4349 domain-containing protein [Halalkalibacillus halophilus]
MKTIRNYLLLCTILFIPIVLVACSSNDGDAAFDDANETTQEDSDQSVSMNTNSDHATEDEQAREESSNGGTDGQESTEHTEDAIESSRQQMVIYTGDLTIEVDQYEEAETSIREEVNARNGYIVETSSEDHENDRKSGHMTVRIPQEHFQDFMNNVQGNAMNVINQSTRGNDVTEEFVDLESRLRSKETLEDRLLTFMQDAGNTEDLLEISNDLSRVQEEIEQLKGRMQYLEDHVAFSTVTIHLQEASVEVPELQDQSSLNTLERAQQLFMSTVNSLLSAGSHIAVFLIGLSPVLIPLLIVGGIIYWRKRRRRISNE